MVMVRHSVMVSLPIWWHTAKIIATEATFTASKNTDTSFELRIFLTSGLSNGSGKKPCAEFIFLFHKADSITAMKPVPNKA